MTQTKNSEWVSAGSLEALRAEGRKVISAGGRTLLVVADGDEVFALDNRCPHMGFPLHRGTVENGILTCHWHHAKFDLRGGCTLDPFADDAPAFPVRVENGEVLVSPRPRPRDEVHHWRRKLQEGMEQDIRLVMAKSAIEMVRHEDTAEAIRRAAQFGVRNRNEGWSAGMSILSALANVFPHLSGEDVARALYHGVTRVARFTANQPPDFDLQALDTSETRADGFLEWFRTFSETRSADAAERERAAFVPLPLSDTGPTPWPPCSLPPPRITCTWTKGTSWISPTRHSSCWTTSGGNTPKTCCPA